MAQEQTQMQNLMYTSVLQLGVSASGLRNNEAGDAVLFEQLLQQPQSRIPSNENGHFFPKLHTSRRVGVMRLSAAPVLHQCSAS